MLELYALMDFHALKVHVLEWIQWPQDAHKTLAMQAISAKVGFVTLLNVNSTGIAIKIKPVAKTIYVTHYSALWFIAHAMTSATLADASPFLHDAWIPLLFSTYFALKINIYIFFSFCFSKINNKFTDQSILQFFLIRWYCVITRSIFMKLSSN